MDLTKQYFDKRLSALIKNMASKKDLKQLESRVDDKISKLADTVDKLAQSVAEGFADIDGRFRQLQVDLNDLDLRSQVHTLQKRVERLESQFPYRH